MKKLPLLFGCFISVLSTAQEIDKPYDFPVKPGTEQWAKLTTSKQMDEVCVIPDEVLKNMSTEALLITCLNYPRLIDIYSADNLQKGFDYCSIHFNGLKELLNRSDLSSVLIKSYPDIDIQEYSIKGNHSILSFLQIGLFELLLAQNDVICNFDSKQKIGLISLAIKNLEIRKSKGESVGRQITTALILSRVLMNINSNKNLTLENDKRFKVFNSTGTVLDTSIINRIIDLSKEIYSGQINI